MPEERKIRLFDLTVWIIHDEIPYSLYEGGIEVIEPWNRTLDNNKGVSVMENIRRFYAWAGMAMLAVVICVFPRMAFASAAPVHGVRPVRSVNIWELNTCPKAIVPGRGQRCIRTGSQDVDTIGLAEMYGTSPAQIRKDNPLRTVAICRNRNGRWLKPYIRTIADRASNDIWRDCHEPYTYIPPNETVVVAQGEKTLPDYEHELLNRLRKCVSDDCKIRELGGFGIRVSDGRPSPSPETIKKKTDTSEGRDKQMIAQLRQALEREHRMVWILAIVGTLLVIAVGISCIVLVRRLRRAQQEIRKLNNRDGHEQPYRNSTVQTEAEVGARYEAMVEEMKSLHQAELEQLRDDEIKRRKEAVDMLSSDQVKWVAWIAGMFGIENIQTQSPHTAFQMFESAMKVYRRQLSEAVSSFSWCLDGKESSAQTLHDQVELLRRTLDTFNDCRLKMGRILGVQGVAESFTLFLETLKQQTQRYRATRDELIRTNNELVDQNEDLRAQLEKVAQGHLASVSNGNGEADESRKKTLIGLHPVTCASDTNLVQCVRAYLERLEMSSWSPLEIGDVDLLLRTHSYFCKKRTYTVKVDGKLHSFSSSREEWDLATERALGRFIPTPGQLQTRQ